MDDVVVIGCVAIIAIFATLGVVVVFNKRDRIKRVEAKAGPASVSFDFYEAVKKEVARVSAVTQADMAKLDRQMIDFWESESFRDPERGVMRLEILEEEISRIESLFDHSSDDDKYRSASQLRELYREYLRHARDYWASSANYQTVKQRVVAGLLKIEQSSRAASE